MYKSCEKQTYQKNQFEAACSKSRNKCWKIWNSFVQKEGKKKMKTFKRFIGWLLKSHSGGASTFSDSGRKLHVNVLVCWLCCRRDSISNNIWNFTRALNQNIQFHWNCCWGFIWWKNIQRNGWFWFLFLEIWRRWKSHKIWWVLCHVVNIALLTLLTSFILPDKEKFPP